MISQYEKVDVKFGHTIRADMCLMIGSAHSSKGEGSNTADEG